MTHERWFGIVLFVVAFSNDSSAQGTKSDYERADRLGRGASTPSSIRPNWLKGGERFWYERESQDGGKGAIEVDCLTGATRALVHRNEIAKSLHEVLGRDSDLVVLRIDVSEDAKVTALVRESDEHYVLEIDDGDKPKLIDISSDHPFKIRPNTRGRSGGRFRRARGRVDVVFVNNSDDEVSLEWLQGEGESVQYGIVRPHESKTQNTVPGHRWAVVGPNGDRWAEFTAERELGVAAFEGPMDPGSSGTSSTTDSDRERRRRERGDPSEPTDESSGLKPVIRDHDVYLIDSETGEEHRLTEDGSETYTYQNRFTFSEDRRFFFTQAVESGQGRIVTMIESSPRDQVQPKIQTYAYDKPGDVIDRSWPIVFDVEGKRSHPISRDLFATPFSIQRLRWDPNRHTFTFLYNQRGHQVLRVIEVNGSSGEARALIEEKSDTFIDYSGKTFLHFLDGTGELIWMSERDGWNHLYLYDRDSAEVKNQITKGEWVVRGVEEVDEENRVLWFSACGVFPDQDPYYIHHCRVNFDGTGLRVLTQGDGSHEVEFSPDKRFFVDTYSRVDFLPFSELRSGEDGSLICALSKVDPFARESLAAPLPERFVAKGRDGKTDIYGVIFRPSQFDSSQKYPVIENIYAGPHGQHVPKTFRPVQSGQSLAEIGFIVVRIDGMGTNWRAKVFHDVAWKDLKDAGFPDRIAWMKAAASQYPSMDLTRVGIYGGSAGGQNALRGLLDYPNFYKAGVADCGCHDNRMDKIWWNEQWMGWPVDESYASSSNVEDAHMLEGALLLTVGELDRNVDPASTMQVVDALIRADKDFELVVFPGQGHGAGGGPYGTRRMRDFFVRVLWGFEPRRD